MFSGKLQLLNGGKKKVGKNPRYFLISRVALLEEMGWLFLDENTRNGPGAQHKLMTERMIE